MANCENCVAGNHFYLWIANIYSRNDTCSKDEIPDTPKEVSSLETFLLQLNVMFTIIPTVFLVVVSMTVKPMVSWDGIVNCDSTLGLIFEFSIIVVPLISIIALANEWAETMFAMCLLLAVVMYLRKISLEEKSVRNPLKFGKQPDCLTFGRSMIYMVTVTCILAVDFEIFPKKFRKSRRFGVGLMDAGIGLFAFNMGTVSKIPPLQSNFKKTSKMVIVSLLLGFTRTIAVNTINYSQDVTEYGKHLNAFFTLGLTKLFGTMVSSTITNYVHLLPLGAGILIIHEIILQSGLSNFILDDNQARDTFFKANREGICSLPGFLAIYILSMYIGHVLRSDKTYLNYIEYMKKLNILTKLSGLAWILAIASLTSVGISRRMCNLGYAVWILAVALTITLLFIIVADLISNDCRVTYINHKTTKSNRNIVKIKPNELPSLIVSINKNGLSYFLIANLLTGAVNIFLAPDARNKLETTLILVSYMLISSSFVYILHRLKIKIA